MRLLQIYKAPESAGQEIDAVVYKFEEASAMAEEISKSPESTWIIEAVEMTEEEYKGLEDSD